MEEREVNVYADGNGNTVRVHGRHVVNADGILLAFSGSAVEFLTDSPSVEIELLTDAVAEGEEFRARAAVYVDDGDEPADIRMLTEERTRIILALDECTQAAGRGDGTGAGLRKVRVVRMSEAAFAGVTVTRCTPEAGYRLYASEKKSRTVEFIGDSITCGYGNEASNELDPFKTCEENPMDGYAVLTSKELDADYQLTSWSGIGVITDWIPEEVNEPLEDILMQELYLYADKSKKVKWDYGRFKPDVIVINLGTNDHSYTRGIPERIEAFAEKYYGFLEQVHASNPGSALMPVMGTMGQELCDEQERQLMRFAAAHPFVRVKYVRLPVQTPEEDGYGADFHPSKKTHRKTAEYLAEQIREFMDWR